MTNSPFSHLRGYEERLSYSLVVQNFAHVLGLTHVTLTPINEDDVHSGCWFRIQSSRGTECFMSLVSGLKSGGVVEFRLLSLIEKDISREFTITDFGYWKPPTRFQVFHVSCEDPIQGSCIEFQVTFSQLSWEHYHSLLAESAERIVTQISITREICLSTLSRMSNQAVSAYLRSAGDFREMPVNFVIEWRGGCWRMIRMEEAMKFEGKSINIEGEIVLGSITLGLNEYLALQPGDEIILSNSMVLPALLRVAGVVVAQGEVRFDEGELKFSLDGSKNVDVSGNFCSESSIQRGKGGPSKPWA
ncbi:MAG: FliM/FliN family flagellar motor switch protein [Bdellovibrionales bacterium]|nr:FliM/FliN family flagellar motor switch protein [Bdellovibrionales bacterium]